jgi:hypothetical protein
MRGIPRRTNPWNTAAPNPRNTAARRLHGFVPNPHCPPALSQGVPHRTAVPALRPHPRRPEPPRASARPRPGGSGRPGAPCEAGRGAVQAGWDRLFLARHADLFSAGSRRGNEGRVRLFPRSLASSESACSVPRDGGHHGVQAGDRKKHRHHPAHSGFLSLGAARTRRAPHQNLRRQGARAASAEPPCVPGSRAWDILSIPGHPAASRAHRAGDGPRRDGGSIPSMAGLQGRSRGRADKAGCPHSCLYCLYGHMEGRALRRRDAARVVREVAATRGWAPSSAAPAQSHLPRGAKTLGRMSCA